MSIFCVTYCIASVRECMRTECDAKRPRNGWRGVEIDFSAPVFIGLGGLSEIFFCPVHPKNRKGCNRYETSPDTSTQSIKFQKTRNVQTTRFSAIKMQVFEVWQFVMRTSVIISLIA